MGVEVRLPSHSREECARAPRRQLGHLVRVGFGLRARTRARDRAKDRDRDRDRDRDKVRVNVWWVTASSSMTATTPSMTR